MLFSLLMFSLKIFLKLPIVKNVFLRSEAQWLERLTRDQKLAGSTSADVVQKHFSDLAIKLEYSKTKNDYYLTPRYNLHLILIT